MRAAVNTALAVGVIVGWFLMMLWMVLAIADTAVHRTVTVPPCVTSIESGGLACAPVP